MYVFVAFVLLSLQGQPDVDRTIKADKVTEDQLQALIAAYKQGIKDFVPSSKTCGELYRKQKALNEALIGVGTCPKLRQVISNVVIASLGQNGAAPVDKEKTTIVWTRIINLLVKAMDAMDATKKLCGWMPRPDEVKRILSMKANPTFAEAAPNLADFWNQEEVALWQSTKTVNNGQHLPADNQTIGDCVSHGYGRGLDYLYCVKQSAGLVDGYVEGQTSAMTEDIYGISRAGKSLGSVDGSNGIWAIDALKANGYIFRQGKPYDGKLAKKWGKDGVPVAERTHLLSDYALLNTPRDMANALKAGSPCPICSILGFTKIRNADGICKKSGKWGHCMVVIGLYRVVHKWYFVILQSWGQNMPSGPCPAGGEAPNNSFGCSWDTMGRILAEGDSYALSGVDNWEPINWIM